MPPRLLPPNAHDPLVDNLYCQAPFSPHDLLSKSTGSATYTTDEPTIRRYEDAARRYLTGSAPFLITAALRGPFDHASGWVNPWASAAGASQSTTQQSTSTSASLRKTRSPALCEPSTSPLRDQTQTTESSCHLPSPESLLADAHPFLEMDEIAVLEKWRKGVQSNNVLARDEFWASTSRSAAKRPRDDSPWLKRRAEKRPRAQEPEPKLSSPVSVVDKASPGQGASSSPLSTPTSPGHEPTPLQGAERPKTEANLPSEPSTVARAPRRSFSSISRRVSPRQKLPSRSETWRGGNDSSRLADNGSVKTERCSAGSFKYTINRTSSRHTTSVRRSSPVAEQQSGPVSSGDSSLSSSSSQPGHDGDVQVKQEPDDIPITSVGSIVAVKTEEVEEESLPQEDRILQMIDPNATLNPGTGRSKDVLDLEDDVSSAAKLAHKVLFCKDFDPIGYSRHLRAVANRASNSIASGTPLASSPCPGPPGAGDNPGVLPQVDGVMETCDAVAESTSSTPVSATVDISACSSSVPASSPAALASTSVVEDDATNHAMDAASVQHQQPSKPAHPEVLITSPSHPVDRATPQLESQAQRPETFSTPLTNHHMEDVQASPAVSRLSTPSERLATQQQSPWMHDTISSAINDTPGEQSRPCDATRGDQQSQSVAISTEAQSPWMARLPSQPQEHNDTFSSNSSSPQLPPPSQEAPGPSPVDVKADHSALLSDASYTDFSIKSFSSFMSPQPKHRPMPLISDNHLPRTPSLLASATRNPWQTNSSKSKKRVSWAPLPHEADTKGHHTPTPDASFSRASPPPAHPVPDDLEEGTDVFRKHFVSVKRRTDPIRQRLLPTASQQIQRSPETDAMARAFATADGSPGGSEGPGELGAAKEADVGAEVAITGGGKGAEVVCEGGVDDVDDVLANLNEFLTSWDVDADLEKARADGLAKKQHREPPPAARTSALHDVEIGGW